MGQIRSQENLKKYILDNTIYQNLWNVANTVLGGKLSHWIYVYILEKGERSKINNLFPP